MRGVWAVLTHQNMTVIKHGEFPAKVKRYKFGENKQGMQPSFELQP